MITNEPPIYITRPLLPDFDSYTELLREVWDRQYVTNFGPLEQRLQQELTDYFNVRLTQLFANGHLAIEAALRAVGRRGDVITTPFTFASTTQAIASAGCKPVFADITAGGLCLDPQAVMRKITPDTVAILATHVYGIACDTDAFDAIGQDCGIPILYDAAHGFAATHKGRSLVSYGDAAILSFHATKLFGTVEGGALIHNTDRISSAVSDRFRNFGISADGVIHEEGSNAKMSELHAAVGLLNLRRMDEVLNRRLEIKARYDRELRHMRLVTQLPGEGSSNASYYPLMVDDSFGDPAALRQRIIAFLEERNVFCRAYFSPALHLTPAFAEVAGGEVFPCAEKLASRALCIPIYYGLSDADQDRVVDGLKAAEAALLAAAI